jgi:hypothetical protein
VSAFLGHPWPSAWPSDDISGGHSGPVQARWRVGNRRFGCSPVGLPSSPAMVEGTVIRAGADLEAAEPWLRMRGESGAAYRAFEAFRDAGPARTLARAARELGRDYRMVRRWAARHRWEARVLAWDRHVGRATAAQRAIDVERVRVRHLAIAEGFLDKLATRLERLDPDELSTDQLGKWLDIATRVERLATADESASAGVAVSVDLHTELDHAELPPLAAYLQQHPERIPVVIPFIERALSGDLELPASGSNAPAEADSP